MYAGSRPNGPEETETIMQTQWEKDQENQKLLDKAIKAAEDADCPDLVLDITEKQTYLHNGGKVSLASILRFLLRIAEILDRQHKRIRKLEKQVKELERSAESTSRSLGGMSGMVYGAGR